jgi:hypothetical protein
MGLERDELAESPYPEKFLNFVQIDGEWFFEENLGGKFGDRAHFWGLHLWHSGEAPVVLGLPLCFLARYCDGASG